MEWRTELKKWVEGRAQRAHAPSVVVAMARGGELIYEQYHGYRDVEAQIPTSLDAVYSLASVTKSFTALAIMMLQEQGKLSVNDPVVKFLPEFRTGDAETTRQVTIHHLLSHTAGLPPLPSRFFAYVRTMKDDPAVPSFPVDINSRPPIDTYEELLAYLAELKYTRLGPPGAQFSYSNEGWCLLGAIVERASGKSYPDFLQQRLFDPAGMSRTSFNLDRVNSFPEVVKPYSIRQVDGQAEVFYAPPWHHCDLWAAAGCLFSNARDLLRYLEIYRTGGTIGARRFLTPASVDAMIEPHISAHTPGGYYGYGLSVTPDFHGAKLAEHGGGKKGVSTQIATIPERGLTAVVLINLEGRPSQVIATGALQAAQGLPPGQPRNTYTDFGVESATLNDYVGDYDSGEGGKGVVSVVDGQLRVQIGGFPIQTARPVAADGFTITPDEDELYVGFRRAANGEVNGVTFGSRIIPRA